jgi:hypothetical protein
MRGLLLKYSLPAIIIGVAAFQFYQVYYHQLSRWKGGGFGMYSEVHPLWRQVWIISDDSTFQVKKQPKLYAAAYRLKMKPDYKNTHAFAVIAANQFHKDNITIQVWEPQLDITTNRLSRKRIQEVKYAK